MKTTDNELLEYYFMGWELSERNDKFPDWFEFYIEKRACLEGYNDNSIGLLKSKEEILKELKK